MEIVGSDDDLGGVVWNGETIVTVATGRLDGSLDGLSPRVHRQAGVEPGQSRQFRAKEAEVIDVHGAGHECKASELPVKRGDHARMQVAQIIGGVGAHHVDVAFAVDIDQMGAATVGHDSRQGRVVVGAETRLAVDGRLGDRCSQRGMGHRGIHRDV